MDRNEEEAKPPEAEAVEVVRLDHVVAWLRHTSQTAALLASALEEAGLDRNIEIRLRKQVGASLPSVSPRLCGDEPVLVRE